MIFMDLNSAERSAGRPGPQQRGLQTDIHILLAPAQRSDLLRSGDVPRSVQTQP
jgi:hypothetical protein